MLGLGLGELCPPVDGHGDVGIGCSSSELGTLESSSVVDGDGDDSDGRVDGRTRKHLLEVEREGVGVVHHRSQRRVDLRVDEGHETGNLFERTSARI